MNNPIITVIFFFLAIPPYVTTLGGTPNLFAIAESGRTHIEIQINNHKVKISYYTAYREPKNFFFLQTFHSDEDCDITKTMSFVERLDIVLDNNIVWVPPSVYSDIPNPGMVNIDFKDGLFLIKHFGSDPSMGIVQFSISFNKLRVIKKEVLY